MIDLMIDVIEDENSKDEQHPCKEMCDLQNSNAGPWKGALSP